MRRVQACWVERRVFKEIKVFSEREDWWRLYNGQERYRCGILR
jgi:hypothetical protein